MICIPTHTTFVCKFQVNKNPAKKIPLNVNAWYTAVPINDHQKFAFRECFLNFGVFKIDFETYLELCVRADESTFLCKMKLKSCQRPSVQLCDFKRSDEGLMESRPGNAQKALQNGRLFIDFSVLCQALNGSDAHGWFFFLCVYIESQEIVVIMTPNARLICASCREHEV